MTATKKTTSSNKTAKAKGKPATAPKGKKPAAPTAIEKPAKPNTEKPAKAAAEPGPKKLSALDAAAKVLSESSEPLTAKQMIEAMATKGYWTSPGGKTPHGTLHSVVTRVPNLAP